MEKRMDTQRIPLKENWKFHRGICEDAWYRGYDDGEFREVMLPHDWAVEQEFSQEYSSGTGYLAGGAGWYRLHLTIPQEYQGKRISLLFDGVYKNSQVWVNSYYLGKHPYGYTGFTYDVTELLHYGEDNVVSVRVTHTDIADSRWYTGSGITRKVTLLVEEPVHPVQDGIYLTTEAIAGTEACVCVHHEVVNESQQMAELIVESRLVEADGRVALTLEREVFLQPGTAETFSMKGTVANARLWDVEQPYLYTLQTFYRMEGKSYLVEEQKAGLRRAEFDADKGFFLNGHSLKLKGVCVHHDAGTLGAAVTREVWRRRLEILRGCGCNAIRCSHNPHMPELYELCDEMGFLMMDEAFDEWENAKNKWSTGHNVYPPKHQGYFEDFPQWHEADLRAMVRRDRKYTSVILWSIGNEIDYPNDPYCHPSFHTVLGNNDANKPAAERQYNPDKPDARRMVVIAGELSDIVKQEDDSRPVTMALAFPELSKTLGIFDVLGVAGYNYKEGFYEEDHKSYPQIPILGSENGHGYQEWRTVMEHDYISGQFLWTGIDYLGEAHGWPIHGSAAGLLTLAGFPKERFYRRKSYWLEEPVLELVTRKVSDGEESWLPMSVCWNYAPGEEIWVCCYSNLPEVKLFLNGREVEAQEDTLEEGTSSFRLPFEPGCLTAKGYAQGDANALLETVLETAGTAARIDAGLWQEGGLDGGPEISRQNQTGYLYQIEISLKDDLGRLVTWDDRELRVEVTGAGELAGVENGDLSDNTPYSFPGRRTREGRLLVYVRRTGQGAVDVRIYEEEGTLPEAALPIE